MTSLEAPPAGYVLGDRFVVGHPIGSGGMATVYGALDRHHDVQVAIKVLASTLGIGDQERFEREARVLAGLHHPGIVRYVAHGNDARHGPFLAMERLDGEDLATRLERAPLEVGDSLELARQLALALACAHDRGVVHRDIKPRNLWLAGSDPRSVKVLDFGIARARGATSLTGTNAIIGTVGYMSPEQARGAPSVDAKADLFSLGCVLYECLTGTLAFPGDHVVAVLVKLLHDEPPPLRDVRPDLPVELDLLVTSLLAKDSSDRPGSASAVVAAIESLGAVTAPPPRPAGARSSEAESSSSSGEQRILQLLLVDPCDDVVYDHTVRAHRLGAADAHRDATDPLERGLAQIERTTTPFQATLTPLRNGMVLVTLSERGSARDRAEAAGAAALAIVEATPRARVAVASGRGASSRGVPGGVIDRCAEVLAAVAPGRVGIDATSARLLEERFVVEVSDGSPCLRLVRERAAPGGDHLLLGKPAPCVGRGKELALLAAMVEESIEESLARSVLVTATAGAGKSRLAHEVIRCVANRPALQIIAVRGDPVEAGSNLAMLKLLVRRIAGIENTDPTDACERALRSVLDGAAPDPERACEFLVSDVLGRPIEAARTPEFRAALKDPTERGAWLERSVFELVDAYSRRGPLVLVLDDLHWAGDATIAYVGEILRRLHARPLFVLALARPEVDARFTKPWPASQRIVLDPLTRRAATELVRTALGPAVADSVVALLVDRAQGNAFYLEELVRAFAAGRHELPETVQAMVEARLQHEDADARHAMRSASVFGQRSSAAAIATLMDRLEPAVRVILDRLANAELLDREHDERDVFVFRHAIVRDVAYAMVPASDHVEVHRRAAKWLEDHGETDPMVLAGHHEAAGDHKAAARFLTDAVVQVAALGQIQRSVELADRTLAMPGLTERRARLVHIYRSSALMGLGRFAEAEQAARDAIRLAPHASTAWMGGTAIRASVLCFLGQPAEAMQLAGAMVRDSFQALGDSALTLWNVGMVLATGGPHDQLRAVADRAELALSKGPCDPAFAILVQGVVSLAAINAGTNVGRALEYAESAGALLPHIANSLTAGWCEWWRAWVFWISGQDERALATARRLLQEPQWQELSLLQSYATSMFGYFGSSHTGVVVPTSPMIRQFITGGEAAARFTAGDLEAAEQLADLALENAAVMPWTAPSAATILARIALGRGDPDRALALLDRGLEVARTRCAPIRHTAEAWACLVDVHLARNDPQAARGVSDEARAWLLEIARGIGPPWREAFLRAKPYSSLV